MTSSERIETLKICTLNNLKWNLRISMSKLKAIIEFVQDFSSFKKFLW